MTMAVSHLFGRVEAPYWDDKPVAIVAGGPSLAGFDFERLRAIGCHVLAVKGSIFDLPWADAGFGIDRPRLVEWWDRFDTEVTMPIYYGLDPDWLATVNRRLPRTMIALKRLRGNALPENDGEVYSGGTSGFGAFGIIKLKRARRVVAFGYDYGGAPPVVEEKVSKRGRVLRREVPAKGWRHNDKHYIRPRSQSAQQWTEWAAVYDEIAPPLATAGVEVVNASPHSNVTAFPRCSVEDGVALLRAWTVEAEAAAA